MYETSALSNNKFSFQQCFRCIPQIGYVVFSYSCSSMSALISLEAFPLTYRLVSSMLLSFPVFGDFLVIFLFFISIFIPLQSEYTLWMILIFLSFFTAQDIVYLGVCSMALVKTESCVCYCHVKGFINVSQILFVDGAYKVFYILTYFLSCCPSNVEKGVKVSNYYCGNSYFPFNYNSFCSSVVWYIQQRIYSFVFI